MSSSAAMNPLTSNPCDELVHRIALTTGLPPGRARRIIDDVLTHHAESVEDYVVRRHRELAEQGWRNPAIFEALRAEIEKRLFKGPVCSVRQIRRMIYG